ncbi:MAG: DUF1329 domain-containing protein [Thermodesulfobacteriota bacterium]|nr:DUF1329 domain-containing protein [Thermodesulfobacteriota bacterium]
MEIRRYIILFFIVLIFNPNILCGEDFNIKPGVVIKKENYTNYRNELQKLLPAGTFSLVDLNLEKGWVTIPVIEKKTYLPPRGFAAATAKNRGRLKVGKDNKIIGNWQGGAPFPEPKTGSELGWDVYRRRECGEEFKVYFEWKFFDKFTDKERYFKNMFHKKNYVGRTDIEPMPSIFGKEEIYWKESLLVTDPFDVKGFSQIRVHYEDITRADDVFSYIPALRRIRRLTGSDVTDPVLGADSCYDDFEGWHQNMNKKMTFRNLGTSEFLVPSYYKKKPPEPYQKGSLFQVNWEIRPLYKLEVNMNDPDYAYSKKIFYVEKERGTFEIAYGEGYDQKGRLWRSTYTMIVRYYDPKSYITSYWGCIFSSHLDNHTSVMPAIPGDNFNLNDVFIPEECFSVRGLLKLAR